LVDRRRAAGEGGARELALEVSVPIWGIGNRGLTVAGSLWQGRLVVGIRRRQAGEEVEGIDSGFIERR
jgi:hypothetical protein